MMNSLDFTSKLAIDSKSIDDLHALSNRDSKKALQEAAKQFEALFFHMLVKSMRDATIKSGLIDSQQTQFYTEMYDQQLSQTLASKGVGLADMMVEQLTRTFGEPDQATPLTKLTEDKSFTPYLYDKPDDHPVLPQADQVQRTSPINQASLDVNVSGSPNIDMSATVTDKSYKLWPVEQDTIKIASYENNVSMDQRAIEKTSNTVLSKTTDFINTLMPHASVASATTGIPAHFMLAQAALESGWGKHEIRRPDNSPSHNLFGIKAGKNWQGETVETVTTEYINGVPQKTVEKFRAYSSYEEGFRDYANLLSNNPRYANVVNTQSAAEFAYGLQKAGYATDPQYGNKLMRILSNPALHHHDVI
ncbi:MAG: flagellar assembly peptidoglycan hydrolase FlgJ [Nitrosomonas sp.]|nr:flagellar assembly peptidoglycan hydrolase FlgJ [Nitrosomonas sp.]